MKRLAPLLLLLTLGCYEEVELPPDTDVTLASMNLLHGFFCEDDHCRLEDRVDLLLDWIEASNCPDVVALQEIWQPSIDLIEPRLGEPCEFTYELIQGRDEAFVDEEILLSRYPASQVELVLLQEEFRHVLYARLSHPIGPVDVFTTHLASGSDGGPDPCEDCPAECTAAGAETLRDCQAVQLAELVDERGGALSLVNGDLNDPPGSFLYEHFVGLGWIDAYLAIGNPECDPSTGVGCTSGRQDEDLTDMESAALGTSERIDYIFVSGEEFEVPGAYDDWRIDPNSDGDLSATALFADEPNPFGDACGPAPAPICWPSDHVGVQVDINRVNHMKLL